MSKGSTQRPTDKEIFDDNYDRIFGKEKPKSDPVRAKTPVGYLFVHSYGLIHFIPVEEYALAYRDTCVEIVPLYESRSYDALKLKANSK